MSAFKCNQAAAKVLASDFTDLHTKESAKHFLHRSALPLEEMERFVAVFVAFLLVISKIGCGFSSPDTVPAFLWSSHHEGLLVDSKDAVTYQVLSPKDLAKTVLTKGGWANTLCSGKYSEQSTDIALVFIGRKLKSSDLAWNRHADQGLIELLKVSFTTSNFSMAFPYIAVSEEETMENSLVSEFTESCQNHLDVNDIAFLESCSVEGENLKKLKGLNAVHEYVGSRIQREQKGKTDLIIFCSQGPQPSDASGNAQSEGVIFSELIDSLKESGATYTVLYASDPHNSPDYPSQQALHRFLADSGSGSVNSTCDGVCQTKATLLEGLFVGIVLLLILISGLCCMMGIDTPSRFETPQDS